MGTSGRLRATTAGKGCKFNVQFGSRWGGFRLFLDSLNFSRGFRFSFVGDALC